MAWVRTIAVNSDGSIIQCGTSPGAFYLNKLTANGLIDTSFGVDGYIYDYVGVDIMAVSIQPDGKIVAIG